MFVVMFLSHNTTNIMCIVSDGHRKDTQTNKLLTLAISRVCLCVGNCFISCRRPWPNDVTHRPASGRFKAVHHSQTAGGEHAHLR